MPSKSKSHYARAVIWISLFSYFGVFCRDTIAGTTQDFFEDIARICNGSFLPNIIGSFLMGFLVHPRSERTITELTHVHVHAATTTGFCGCLTTFSTWTYDITSDLSTDSENNLRGGLEIAFTYLLSLIIGPILFLSSLYFGYHCADATARLFTHIRGPKEDPTPEDPTQDQDQVSGDQEDEDLDPYYIGSVHITELPAKEEPKESRRHVILPFLVLLVLTGVVWMLAAFSWIYNWSSFWRSTFFAMPWAPLGGVARWIFCAQNKKHPIGKYEIPWWTAVANIVAELLYQLALLIAAVAFDSGDLGRVIFEGFASGFCGSLSTISSMMNDIRVLNGKGTFRAYWYAFVTIVGGQIMGLAIGGTRCWGFDFCTP